MIHGINGNSDANQKLNTQEKQDKNLLDLLPTILNEVIQDYAYKMTVKSGRIVSGFEDLASMLNYHPQTLRKWVNPVNPVYPPINALFAICRITGDWRPIELITDYSNNLRGNKK